MKKLGYFSLIILIFVLGYLVVGYIDKITPAKDEAMQAGKTPDDFPESADNYLGAIDGGVELTEGEIKGRNTWLLWGGGNEAFWDWLAGNSFGTFDLLKVLSSYPCDPTQSGYVSKAKSGDLPEGHEYEDYSGHDSYGGNEKGKPYYSYYKRNTRFAYTGLMNEPGFRQATKPDEHGLCLDERSTSQDSFDETVFGRASGIVGLRLFPNPNFDAKAKKAWDPDRFITDPKYYSDRDLVRPYRVAMSCAFCHISHHPLHPPRDPENPGWENLSATIGAQYFWFGRIFAPNATPDNFVWHILDSQQPGAVDTSFLPTDYILNPRAMNAVFDVPARLGAAGRWHQEEMAGGALDLPEVNKKGDSFGVPHVLWDGSDSVGVDAALTRVYINIGEYHQEWIRHIRPLVGLKPQTPIEVKVMQENSVFWNTTQRNADNLRNYLVRISTDGMPLAKAPGGKELMLYGRAPADYQTSVDRGKTLFAENCARCHSSKQPDGDPKSEQWLEEMRQMVMQADFLDNNYLATDARIPVTELETEICSSMASNAVRGHIWDNFSSETYKNLPSMGTVTLNDPVRDKDFEWETPGGGVGYQRVPSLIAIWSTAPFLHNNELGVFNSDPSTQGRVDAFNSAIEELLWPEKREGTVRVTDRRTELKVAKNSLDLPFFVRPLLAENGFGSALRSLFGLSWLVIDDGMIKVGPIPKGTPVSLIANINLELHDERVSILGLLKLGKTVSKGLREVKDMDDAQATERLKELVPTLIDASACPDFVIDRGHYFGSKLSDADKYALVDFIKTF
jgi:hypothetical protein